MLQEIVDPRGQPLRRAPRIIRPRRYDDDVMRCGVHVIGSSSGVIGLDGAPLLYKLTTATCLRAWQADFGVATGGTPKASGTSPPAVTVTGVPSCVALRIEIQTTGARGAATFRYSAKNTGSGAADWIEQNITTAATYNAVGALAGMQISFPNSTYTNDNVYQGTCSAWTCQVSGTTASQATAGNQPLILWNSTLGRLFLRGDGTDDFLREATLNLPAAGTTPTFIWGEIALQTWTSNLTFWCSGTTGGTHQLFCNTATPDLSVYVGTIGPRNSGMALNTPSRVEIRHGNSTADYLKLGTTSVTGTNTGNLDAAAGWNFFATSAGGKPINGDIYTCNIHSAIPSAGELSALSAASAARGFAA